MQLRHTSDAVRDRSTVRLPVVFLVGFLLFGFGAICGTLLDQALLHGPFPAMRTPTVRHAPDGCSWGRGGTLVCHGRSVAPPR